MDQALARRPGSPHLAPLVRLQIVVGDTLPACPKCGTTRGDQPACPRCGLATARMAAFQVTRDAVPPDLVAAWQRVREHWGVPRYHDELLQLTAQLERYAWVAAKYREVGRMRNADPVADAELARLRRAAEVTLAVSASVRPERAPRSYGALSAMLLLVMLLAIASFAYARLRPLPAPPVPPLGHGDVEVLGP